MLFLDVLATHYFLFNRNCAICVSRKIQNDYVITYKKRYFQLIPEQWTKVYTKQEACIQEDIYWKIQILVNERVIPYKEINQDWIMHQKAIYRAKHHREKDQISKERAIIRQEERHIASKQRQAEYRKKSQLTT